MKIVTFLMLLIFTSEMVHPKKFDALINRAEELQKAEKLSDALDNYIEPNVI